MSDAPATKPSGLVGRFMQIALGRSSPLVAGRLLSAAITFALPLILVRLLSPSSFGSYKQFFLVGQTVLLVGQLGISQSLYYFLPQGEADRGAYVAQTLILLSGIAVAAAAAIYFGGASFGWLLGDGSLVALRAPLALFASGMLIATPLEGGLVSEGRTGGSAISYVLFDGLRALAMALAAKLGSSPMLFWAAAAVAWVRVGTLLFIVWRGVLPVSRPRRSALKKQLAFALPLAASLLLLVAQRYFSQYAVSLRFSAATFALFTVAAFHMPVVDILYTPACDVMMVAISRAATMPGASGSALAHREWSDTVSRLAALLFPATVAALLFGPTILPLLFTQKYAAAVPLFLLATLEIPLWILPADGVCRAAGDTKFLFTYGIFRIALTGGLVLAGIRYFGLSGAILGNVIAEAISRSGMLLRVRYHLKVGAHRGFPERQLFDWAGLAKIAGWAVLWAVPVLVVRRAFAPSRAMVVLSMAIYAGGYLLSQLRGRSALAIAPTVAPTSAQV